MTCSLPAIVHRSCVYVWFHSGRQHGLRTSVAAVRWQLNISIAWTTTTRDETTRLVRRDDVEE
jgi:hypothetical protein